MGITKGLFNQTLQGDRDDGGRFIKGHKSYAKPHTEKIKQRLRENHNPKSNLNLRPGNHPKGYHFSPETEFKKGEHKSPATEIKKGQHLGPETEFKRENLLGDKHPRWKGGVDIMNERIRKSPEYIRWRDDVYKRDNYICQFCGIKCKNEDIIAHHINSFAGYPDLRFNIDNGKTLCRACHIKEHQWV